MAENKYLIIGQGIAGTILSYRFKKAGIDFKLIDHPRFSRSSRIAAGLANPVVLKRQKWVAGAELFTPNLLGFYRQMEKDLSAKFLNPIPLYHLFQSTGEINDWQQNSTKPLLKDYLGPIHNEKIPLINNPCGYARVNGIFWVDTEIMIDNWREKLKQENLLIEDEFLANDYRGYIHIYCSGHLLSENYPPIAKAFSKTKGQVMIIKSEKLSSAYGLHSSVFTLPIGNNRFKVGATYEHQNLNDEPDKEGLNRLQTDLEKFYKGPYTIVEHLAGVRPNIKDRKPLLGQITDQVYTFNGLGSRGILMAPYLSQHFINYLINDQALNPIWNLKRFDHL